MTITQKKYPKKFTLIRQSDPRLRRKQLSQLKRDSHTNAELRGFLRDLFDNDLNYNLNTKQLKKEYGKHKLYKLLNKSISAGYMQRKVVLTPHDNYQGYRRDYHYILSETPIFRDNLTSSIIEKNDVSQCPHLQCTVKWDSKEIKVKREKKEKKKKQILEPKSIPSLPTGETPEPPSLFLKGKVKIKMELYNSLVSEYTEAIVTMAIERMNTYMDQSGKYRGYACHGEKLRSWLAKDAEQYRDKLANQQREKQQAIERKQREEEIARHQLAEKQRRDRMAEQSAKLAREIQMRAQQKKAVLSRYQKQHPDWIKQSKMDLCNGVYWFMGECRIIGDDVEMELEKLIASHNKSQSQSHFVEQPFKQSEKRTEMGIESNNNAEVVLSIKKMEIKAKIGHSVLNQSYPVQKSTTEIGYQAQLAQNKWKNQLNSLLKCYGRYPMKL